MATATVATRKAGKKAAAKVREVPAPAAETPKAGAKAKATAGPTVTVSGTGSRVAPATSRRDLERASEAFKLASDPGRMQVILQLEAVVESNVGTLATTLGVTQPALSHALSLLRHAGAVERRRDGKSSRYSLAPKGEALARMIREVEAMG